MKLYHGSNVEVKQLAIKTSDFGPAFYTTSSLSQAQEWAKTKKMRRKKGEPTVSCYDFDEKLAKEHLNTKHFFFPDEDWLTFIVANRRAIYKGKKYDLVIGPVADDRTIIVIDNYMKGLLNPKMALEALEPQKLTDQYAFLTKKSISYLKYEGVEIYGI